jgi:hypothetical protein
MEGWKYLVEELEARKQAIQQTLLYHAFNDLQEVKLLQKEYEVLNFVLNLPKNYKEV